MIRKEIVRGLTTISLFNHVKFPVYKISRYDLEVNQEGYRRQRNNPKSREVSNVDKNGILGTYMKVSKQL